MGYLIGLLVVVLVLVEIIRVIVRVLSVIARQLVALAGGIGHVVAAIASFLVVVAPEVGLTVALIGLLWAACWLASEVWYFWRDTQIEQRWFDGIAPRIQMAMAVGGSYAIANPTMPPQAPAFGLSSEHPLTLPIPRHLQRLVDAGAMAIGLSKPMLMIEKGFSESAPPSKNANPQPGKAATAPHYCVPAPLQLNMVRQLMDIGTRGSASVRAVTENETDLGQAQGQPIESQAINSQAIQTSRSSRPLLIPPYRIDDEQRAVSEAHVSKLTKKGRLIVEASDGVQVGVDNRQHNFYTFKVTTPKIENLAARLDASDVQVAVRRLAADPENIEAREALLRELAPGGLALGGPTSQLEITALHSKSSCSGSWLDGTVLFRDVSHGQIGNHNTQRNEFIYTVTPKGAARDMLACNPRLAKALVDCAFPARGSGDTAALGQEFRSALKDMSVNWDDGRMRSQHYDAPAAGRTLKINAHDGVSVGARSTVTDSKRVTVAQPAGDVRSRVATRPTTPATTEAVASPLDDYFCNSVAPRTGPITRGGPAVGGISAV